MLNGLSAGTQRITVRPQYFLFTQCRHIGEKVKLKNEFGVVSFGQSGGQNKRAKPMALIIISCRVGWGLEPWCRRCGRLRHERVQLHDRPAYRSVNSGRVETRRGSNKLYSKYDWINNLMDAVGRSRSMRHECYRKRRGFWSFRLRYTRSNLYWATNLFNYCAGLED